ncbi:hypothetical protein ABTD85_23660, partial [Acinetobacter baumannii]
LLCHEKKLAAVKLTLVYLDVATEQETCFEESRSAADLEAHFRDHCQRFIAWATVHEEHRRARDAALAALKFPFAGFHD